VKLRFSVRSFYFLSTPKLRFCFLLSPVFLSALVLSPVPIQAQRNISGEVAIRQTLERLDTLGSVMMIGAHPDDENTALLAYFSRGLHMRTAYLSLTRGEGGQNLIGSEQGDELGIIRTQELLAARKIDGGEQFFTRAIDFGFSKTADETFTKWPREKLLGDVVWDIRRFRPDVIVLRFSGTPRDGHGQHQVSAIIGKEAFSAAADPSKFPEQLQWVQPWQAKRLMWNTFAFTAEQQKEEAAIKDKLAVDLGTYSPELGYSYSEIAGMSRSQHRSQGMGAPEPKGSQRNYLVTIAGDRATKEVFEGIDTTWSRIPGGASVAASVEKARDGFTGVHAETLLPLLVQVRTKVLAMKDPLAVRKLHEIDEAIGLISGLWLDAASDKYAATPGSGLKIAISALARVPVDATLVGVKVTGMEGVPQLAIAPATLVFNQPSLYSLNVSIPQKEHDSQPYWLVEPKDGAMYRVSDPQLIGNPENAPVLEAHFRVKIAGAEIEIARPVEYRYIDHIYGEVVRPLAIVPPVGVELPMQALVFGSAAARKIDVLVKANTARASGEVNLDAPTGWHIEPAARHFDLNAVDEQTTASFTITPPSADAQGEIRAVASVGGHQITSSTEVIAYPHIPVQTLFPPSDSKLVRASIRTLAKNIGYIVGAGDEVPSALRQIDCTVTFLSPDDLVRADLSKYDAIVTGVRAFNVRPDLRANYQRLFDYAQNGGTVVVQYNVLEGGPFGGNPTLLEHVGPYPIKVSRDRVTVEDVPVTFPNPQNPLLHSPNEITERDFDGWVQERGLYFANEWDPKYQSVLESHDPGEQPMPGGMLYTKYGRGVYIFSAYSWFRELPAGVPGAFRIFANMLSAAKTQ
jgi:LmbE family N-acetylglucosaminyl deacetylase